jgi:hypothetical protein
MIWLKDPWIWLNLILGVVFGLLAIFLGSWPRRLFPPGPPTVFGWVLRTIYVVGGFVYIYGGMGLWFMYLRSRFMANAYQYIYAYTLGLLLTMPLLFWKAAHQNSEAARNDLTLR